METQVASPSKAAMLVRRRNGTVQHVDSYEDLADALLAGRLSPDDAFCAIPPPAESPVGQPDRDKPTPKPQANWKPVRKAKAFPVKVLFNPVMAHADSGVLAGLATGAILNVLVFTTGFLFAAEFPVFGQVAALGFGSRLILVLVPIVLLPLVRWTGGGGAFVGWLADTLLALAVLKGAGLNVTFYDANTFLMGLWLALAVTTLLSGIVLAAPGALVGMVVGMVRRPRLARLPG